MRIVLHIGQQKTGSTSLQRALVADRSRLLKHGILYPDAGHTRNPYRQLDASHNGLFHRLGGQTELGNRVAGQPRPQLWQTTDEIREAIQEQIESSSPDTLLISSEHAFRAADDPEPILDRLDEMVPGDKEVVVYLRRPDKYLMSLHKQKIQMGGRGLHPLHDPERFERLARTCQVDHTRAVGLYVERYENVRLFNYDVIGNIIDHFYSQVLDIRPPHIDGRFNPSLPSVMANLTLAKITASGPLSGPQNRALLRFGERESVDLLGAENRARLVEVYKPHNEFLGQLSGQTQFFADLEQMTVVPGSWLTPDDADARYEEMFRALIEGPSIQDLRRDCSLLEASGQTEAAAELFAANRRRYDQSEVDWFDQDLRESSDEQIRLGRNREYVYEPSTLAKLTRLTDRAKRYAKRLANKGRAAIGRG